MDTNKLSIINDTLVFSNLNFLRNIIITDDFDSITEEYSCKICCDFIYKKEPLQCKEGHFACKNCFEQHLLRKKECMVCRVQIKSISELGRNRFIEDSLSKKKIKCPFSYYNGLFNEGLIGISTFDQRHFDSIYKDNNGCSEIIKIGDLESHLNNCSSRFIKCSNDINGCEEVIRFKNLSHHISYCGYSYIGCSSCNFQLKRKQLKSHHEICPEITILCNQCSNNIKRGEMDNHIESKCPNTTIECDYLEYGCSVKFKRCELDNHYNQTNHTKYMTKLIQNQSKQLIDSNNKINNLNDIINQLNDTINTIFDILSNKNEQLNQNNNTISNVENMESSKYIKWEIYNYSSISKTDFRSNTFKFNNYELFLSYFSSIFGKTVFIYSKQKINRLIRYAKLKVVNSLDTSKNINLDCKINITEYNNGFRLGAFSLPGDFTKHNGFISQDDELIMHFKIKFDEPTITFSNDFNKQ